MKKLQRVGAFLSLVAGSMAYALSGEREARACGGCFVPPPPPMEPESAITGEQMILSISTTQTTLYDEITYSGSPESFAWVLPIKGTVTVGLSADILFQTINQLTASSVTEPPTNCPPPPVCAPTSGGGGCGSSSATSAAFGAEDAGVSFAEGTKNAAVTVLSQKQVGPYETVQLKSNNGSALNDWLTLHGYQIPSYTQTIIDAYVADQFDFLALKLVPGEGVQAMQPVRVTSQGAAPSLPLHMVAVGTGPVTGITIWVVADGRWEPSNFPTFTISNSELAWDWLTSSSNYETLRLSKEAALQGRGWQIESSLELSQYTISQDLLENVEYDAPGVGGYEPAPPVSAVDAGGVADGSADARSPVDAADAASKTDAADAAVSGDARSRDAEGASDAARGADAASHPDASHGSDASGGDAGEDSGDYDAADGGGATAAATADLAVLFEGIMAPNVRITRMRSDVAKSALSVDMALQASTDQSELSNEYLPSQEIGEPSCAVYDENCNQTGVAPRSQAAAAASGGCATTRPQNELGTTLAFLIAFGGVSALRGRRKRRSVP